jgi:hypothetical protein
LTSTEALEIAKRSTPEKMSNPQAVHTDGVALGETVEVMPVDSGLDPVRGALMQCSADEIAVQRSDPRAGSVMVHFPRFGYQMKKCPN